MQAAVSRRALASPDLRVPTEMMLSFLLPHASKESEKAIALASVTCEVWKGVNGKIRNGRLASQAISHRCINNTSQREC
jgi:hypothetical protein